ncbi:MAG: hypothetical protein WC389_09285 [Lutibacter sp.]
MTTEIKAELLKVLTQTVYFEDTKSPLMIALSTTTSSLQHPPGKVSVLRITDKQFGNIMNFWGVDLVPKEPPPMQLELF